MTSKGRNAAALRFRQQAGKGIICMTQAVADPCAYGRFKRAWIDTIRPQGGPQIIFGNHDHRHSSIFPICDGEECRAVGAVSDVPDRAALRPSSTVTDSKLATLLTLVSSR